MVCVCISGLHRETMAGNDKFFEEELDRFGTISVPFQNWHDAVNVMSMRHCNVDKLATSR